MDGPFDPFLGFEYQGTQILLAIMVGVWISSVCGCMGMAAFFMYGRLEYAEKLKEMAVKHRDSRRRRGVRCDFAARILAWMASVLLAFRSARGRRTRST